MSSILVIGESGSGKSTALRNLDPSSTFIINALNKPLPFKGWAKKFGANVHATDNAQQIASIISKIDKQKPEIKVIIIDDFQAVMTNEFMRTSMERGYEKFVRLGKGIWDIVTASNNSRNDLKVFMLAHSDTDANGKIKCKTVGKLVDEKISLEGMCTIVLHSKIIDGQYMFITQNDGISIAKSPMGMFPTQKIRNDFKEVIESIDAYYIDEEPAAASDIAKELTKDQEEINIKKADHLNALRSAKTMDELKDAFTAATNYAKEIQDNSFVNDIKAIKDSMKTSLEDIPQ